MLLMYHSVMQLAENNGATRFQISPVIRMDSLVVLQITISIVAFNYRSVRARLPEYHNSLHTQNSGYRAMASARLEAIL